MAILVKDVMIDKVVTCKKDTTVTQAAKIMKKANVGSIVIIEGKKPVGIVTREDIVNKIVAKGQDPRKTTTKNIMTTPLVTCSPDEELSEVTKRMAKHGYERLPVIFLDKLQGMVSVRQILNMSPGMLDLLKERLESVPSLEYEDQETGGECELCGNYSEELHNINDRWVCDNCKEEASEI